MIDGVVNDNSNLIGGNNSTPKMKKRKKNTLAFQPVEGRQLGMVF